MSATLQTQPDTRPCLVCTRCTAYHDGTGRAHLCPRCVRELTTHALDDDGRPLCQTDGELFGTVRVVRAGEQVGCGACLTLQIQQQLCPSCGQVLADGCARWCKAAERDACRCGHPLCGECMRYGGTSTSGLPVRR